MIDLIHLLDELPVAYAVWNSDDFIISYANRAFHKMFRTESGEQGRSGDLRLFDLFVDVNPGLDLAEEKFNPANVGVVRYVTNSNVKCKRFDGTTFLGWFRISDVEGHPGLRAGFVFEDYDEYFDDKSWSDFAAIRISNSADIAYLEMFSHEINNALAIVNLGIERLALSRDERNLLIQPLERLRSIGARTTRMALEHHKKNLGSPDLFDSFSEAMRLEKPTEFERGNQVLIVDDDPELLESLAELLRINDFTIFEANSKRAAYEMMMIDKIDIAVIDLRLGNEDGRTVAKALLRLKPELKVIYMTGYSNLIPQIQREGNFTVIKKPFKIETLISEINKELAT